eukprot:c25197_g1_i1 orf=48-1022(-)
MGIKGFVEGGLASMVAGCSTHPLDLIKVRMQLQGETTMPLPALKQASSVQLAFATHGHFNMTASVSAPATSYRGPIAVGLGIVRAEGAHALFSGISATMLRQGLYSTTRMGLYEVLKERWSSKGTAEEQGLPVMKKIGAGLVAGAVGAAVGNPADVAMVRMQADGRLPKMQQRNYTSVADALCRMVKQEGASVLWRGSSLTIQRAMVVTASQLSTYDQAKESIEQRQLLPGGVATHVAASCAAGLVASIASNPIDVIKTRFMNMKAEGGRPAYSGALDCVLKTVRAEGPLALYKGFVPTVMRQAPFTIVLFVSLEQIRHLLQKF